MDVQPAPLQIAIFCHVPVPQGSTGRYLHGASSVLGPPGGKGIATPSGLGCSETPRPKARGRGLFSKTTFFSPALIVFVLSLRMTDLTITISIFKHLHILAQSHTLGRSWRNEHWHLKLPWFSASKLRMTPVLVADANLVSFLFGHLLDAYQDPRWRYIKW